MSEKGMVINVKDDGKTAVVSFNRTEACGKCRACYSGFSGSQMLLDAKNGVNAKTGDSVFVELPENGFLTAAAIMYLFPLFAALMGFVLGGAVSEVFGFSLGVSLLILSYLIIRANERRIKTLMLFRPFISEIANGRSEPPGIPH